MLLFGQLFVCFCLSFLLMYFVVFVIAIAVANLHRFSGGRRSQCHEGAIEAY